MRIFFTIIVFFSIGLTNAYAQFKIFGKVENDRGELLIGASVLLKNNRDRILDFSISDRDGKYQIPFDEADSVILEISYIGYKKIKKAVFVDASREIDVKMVEDVVELDEVKLRAPPIIDFGDTINYSVNAFKSQQDRVIADVLRKLPGISVDGDGRVSYMGEPIEKYYIDGLDLLEGRYNLANNNLPADAVSDVQILENHQPIRIYDSLVFSNKTSLNIKLNKNVTLTGSGKLGGGLSPALWEANVSPMLFNKKQQVIASFQSNNTGNNLERELQSFRSSSLNFGQKDYLLEVQSINQPPFNEKFWLDNQSHLGSINYLRKVNEKWEIKGNINYLNAGKVLNGSTETQIFTPNDSIQLSENKRNEFNSNVIKGALFLEKNISSSYYKQSISINSTVDNKFGSLNLTNQSDFNQDLDQSHLWIRNDILAIKKVFNSLITFKSSSNYIKNSELLSVNPAVFPNVIGNTPIAIQHLNKDILDTKNKMSMSKKFGRLLVNPEMGFNLSSEDLHSEINAENESEESSDSLRSNDLSLINLSSYINIKTEYAYKKWILTFKLPLFYRNFWIKGNDLATQENSYTRLNLEPEFNAHYKFNNFWKANFNAAIKNEFGNANRIHSGYILRAYRNLLRFETPLEEIQSQTIGGNIQYRNPIKAFFWSFRYRYGLMNSNIQESYSYSQQGASIVNSLEDEINSTRQMVSMDISKYFNSIKTTFFVNSTAMQMRSPRILNGSTSDIENNNFNYSFGARGTLTSIVEYDYSFRQDFFFNEINEVRANFLRRDMHELLLDVFVTESQYFGVQFQANNNFISDENTGFNQFLNVSYNYIFNKIGLDLTFECRNLLNNQNYISVFADANIYVLNQFQMRPRQFLLSAQFSLGKFD
ncbi:TonB-dependent receptor [Marivirga tractuosa]|uniref:TonB-dependent receptor plug n=1 Tax=Marivirga tractuosa (strain ATCC 23168 / DSM 4126 / NBRC 15989 / NCIMB 1408 / VKM B-1430 / H-43) TaxID=643867 RepID=E4TNA4_MARTH|nr:Plug domain-containing protein [Marivirga tractuosa]ADR23492.1 TonB-dependent receptor plug [Marivirga tractuosa DSM 4126]BDD15829.1 TonB-dependent receptor [Marivirga tractuosa]